MKIFYRIEIWVHKNITSIQAEKENTLSNLKEYLRTEYGSEVEDKPIIVKNKAY